jgi:predicted alpha/beta hydrolase family esterase
MPVSLFPVPALVVASFNDPYVTLPRAKEFAENWGADFCSVGELGHINADSRLGFWPQGHLMLGQLLARVNC